MSGEFFNKVAVVTGGSRGIGREIAADLARAGAQTVIVASSTENLAAASKTIAAAGPRTCHYCGFAHARWLCARVRQRQG